MSLAVPAAATVLLLRHGAFERSHDEGGRRSERLLPEAVAQADALAERLAALEQAPILYSSPQARAVLTAERLSTRLSVPVYADPDLAELRLGRDPDLGLDVTTELWRRARSQPGVPALAGAETLAAVGQRALATLTSAVRAHPGRLVVAVSHGGLVEALLALVSGGSAPRDVAHGEHFWFGGVPLAECAAA